MIDVRKFLAFVFLSLFVFSACGRGTKVGGEELLNIKEQEQQQRLGEILKSPEPEAGEAGEAQQGALGAPSPTPKQEVQAEPQKPPLAISLVSDNPYYDPGPNIQVEGGVIMRITNRDDQTRRFRTSDGAYDSGDLAPGQTTDVPARFKGEFNLEDPHVPFATGFLQVY